MGGTLSYVLSTNNDWYVYRRLKDTNKYSDEPEQTWRNISKETALNRFKHEIYATIVYPIFTTGFVVDCFYRLL